MVAPRQFIMLALVLAFVAPWQSVSPHPAFGQPLPATRGEGQIWPTPRVRGVGAWSADEGLFSAAIDLTTVAADANGVEEPVIVSMQRDDNTQTVTAFIRRVVQTETEFTTRDWWSYEDSKGLVSNGPIPIPSSYTDSSDPVLAQNATGDGIAPMRTYLVARTLNRDGVDAANPTSIRVWASVNGGYSWSGTGSEVDVVTSGTDRQVDKPWIAVSEGGPTAGSVYVSWVRVDMTSARQNEIMFVRSRNGVSKSRACCGYPTTWDKRVRIADLGHVHGPQIVVDAAGYVYVIFVDFDEQQMRIARSRLPGADFPADGSSVFAPAKTISSYDQLNASVNLNRVAGGIRVVPLPAARYNAATNEILVAWTEGETNRSPRSDIRLSRLSADAAMTVTDVTLDSAITSSGVDEFTPVIETDGSGGVVLAYYDRKGVSGNDYQVRVAKLTSTGLLASVPLGETNPMVIGSPCEPDTVGEYQGLWRVNDGAGPRFDLAWTCSDSLSRRTIERVSFR